MTTEHSTGTVVSGDVTLFYRRFGTSGDTPLLILHGANYFDSADWIEVAGALARDREIVAFDQRGFGQSSWSAAKDYTIAAHLADMVAVLDHLRWERAVILGHSRGGVHAILFAARYPERTAGLILADSSPGGMPASPTRPMIGTKPRIFPDISSLEQALSRDPIPPHGNGDTKRLEAFTRAVEGGFILSQRDPDFGNVFPTDGSLSDGELNLWEEMARIKAPTAIVYGTESNRFPAEDRARIERIIPAADFIGIPSGHDMAAMAPLPFMAAVRHLLSRVP